MISIQEIMDAIESDSYCGFCKACGEQAFNVEPDAENYVCESCGKHEVYGAEQLLIMGFV